MLPFAASLSAANCLLLIAMAAIPCGTFKLMVLEKKDARPMENNSHQLEFDFKGQSYTLADATELPSLYQALDEAFKSQLPCAKASWLASLRHLQLAC